ncbi:MAG: hypothetical protein AAF652_20660 [Cyanobacteria bacterium P01_C01_bin.72]
MSNNITKLENVKPFIKFTKVLSLDVSNIEIQAAIVSGIFTVISALIAALAAAIVGQTIANRRKLEEKLEREHPISANKYIYLTENHWLQYPIHYVSSKTGCSQ